MEGTGTALMVLIVIDLPQNPVAKEQSCRQHLVQRHTPGTVPLLKTKGDVIGTGADLKAS